MCLASLPTSPRLRLLVFSHRVAIVACRSWSSITSGLLVACLSCRRLVSSWLLALLLLRLARGCCVCFVVCLRVCLFFLCEVFLCDVWLPDRLILSLPVCQVSAVVQFT
ncbi:hypothetical protein VPH35_009288 [Triticum aestivum]